MKIIKIVLLFIIIAVCSFIITPSSPESITKYPEENQIYGDFINTEQVTSKNRRPFLVIIDAGHGGIEKGAPESTINEKDLNLAIALKLKDLLSKNDIKVILTRERDVNVGLIQRTELANKSKADLFVSIHHNWFLDKKINGTMTLYYPYSNNIPDSKLNSKRFAIIVNETLVNNLKTKDLGIIPRKDLVVLKYTSMPAILVEIGYLSNNHDRSMILSKGFVDLTAKSLCSGIIKVLNEL